MKTGLQLLFCACVLAPLQAQDRILPDDFNADLETQMMRAFLRKQAHEALDRRLEELAAVRTPEQIASYQAKRRKILANALGLMPETCELLPKITGTLQGDGFVVEKLIFDSQESFRVTANLYLPDGEGKKPAILVPCGHAQIGKAYPAYQKACQLLAQHGFVVLCYDPIGQGERKQIYDESGKPAFRASSEHQALGIAPILLGQSLATHMVWDAVRAIDYLESRPEVDPERIGCTGNSGGGNLTSYLMAFDDRIAAAAPGCFMTTHRRKNESPGPGDAEQNLFAQIRDGFDHPDFILTRAPKPTLILAATRDFVPIEGAREAYRQARRIYGLLGHPERISVVEADEKHGFTQPLREAAVEFFARWLQEREIQVSEPEDVPVFSVEELQCTPRGQVGRLTGELSLLELNARFNEQLAPRREALSRLLARGAAEKSDVPLEECRARVRQVTGIRDLDALPRPQIVRQGEGWVVLAPEEGIVIPARLLAGGKLDPVLILRDSLEPRAMEEAERLHQQGHPVMVADVRDIGETRTRNWRFFGADAYIAYMLGRSFLAMRAEDVLVCARFLAGQGEGDADSSRRVRLVAWGEVCPPALHAAALEPQIFGHVRLIRPLASWQTILNSPNPAKHLPNAVQGVLWHYDLPHLFPLVGREKLDITDPVDADGRDFSVQGLIAE